MKNRLHRLPAATVAVVLSLMTALNTVPTFAADDGWMEEENANVRYEPVLVGNPLPLSAQTPRLAPTEPGTTSGAKVAAKTAPASDVMLKGSVEFCVPKGTPIKLKLASVPTLGMKSLNRDIEGNLYPAKLDQKITAKVTEDIYIDENKVIPQGTVFEGAVTKIFPPRRVGRPGSLALTFNEFTTPDGRKFAFRAEANNTRKSTAKTKLKGAGIIAAHAGGGAVVGALVAYQIFGLEQTIAMHGYNIAGGAAAGALMGTAVALMRKGKEAVLEPGDDLNMEIDTDLLIPAATSPTHKPPPLNVPGLEIRVIKAKAHDDGLDGQQLTVKMQIDNNSNRKLNSIDLYIEDDNGCTFPIVTSNHTDHSDMLFTIAPHESKLVTCDFGLEFPKLKRKLIWLDHSTRKVIYEQKLP